MKYSKKKRLIRKAAVWGIITNCFLAFLKFGLGIWGKSQAVVADAVHSLSDMSTDIVILLGVKHWLKPPDRNHPYGHQKFESFVTIFIGSTLLIAAGFIVYHALDNFMDKPLQKLSWFVVLAPAISIILKEVIFRYTHKIGQLTSSTSVKANAWHHRSDAFSSIPILIAVIASSISNKLYFLDNIGALIVAGFIIKIAINFLNNSFSELTDSGISQHEVDRIKYLVRSIKGAKDAHRIRSRKVGGSVFIDLHLEVDGGYSVFKGHEISERVKLTLIKKIRQVIDVVVHIEPLQENREDD